MDVRLIPKPIWLRCVWVESRHFHLSPIAMGAICPCLGREKGELIPSDASGGADGYGWCVAKNQRQHMEDAVDVDVRGPGQSRLFAVYDGHGGAEAVAYVKEELPKIVNTTGKPKGSVHVEMLRSQKSMHVERFLHGFGSIMSIDFLGQGLRFSPLR